MKKDFKFKHITSPSHYAETGGDSQVCDVLNELGQNVLKSSVPMVGGKDLVTQSYDLIKHFEPIIPRVLNPSQYISVDTFIVDLEKWWTKRFGYSPKTFQKRRNLLVDMVNHPVFPIDLLNLNPDQIDAYIQYESLNYSKETARDGKDAIRNKLKAIFMVAQAQGIDYSKWNIRMPSRSKPKHKIVPLPSVVYEMVHFKYSTDPYVNALYQYLCLHGFVVGPRVASEFSILRLKDVHIEEGYLHFYQPKVDEYRMSPLEPEIMCMSNRKSFKNWVDKWRPKVENQYSKDYVYLHPDGKPFTEQGLRKQLNTHIKPVWQQFHPYCMRDWCAIARLIRTKVLSNSFDFYEVSDWFEHSDISVTQHYTKDTKKYYMMASFDWIRAVLKSQKCLGEVNSLESENSKNGVLPIDFSPVEEAKPPWVRTL
ncbi:MAG: site-specific integrase [Candidatus Thermoplasmatota archaeon]|nr:site-specific integrase [Candidatus Thermoplasmatota archaeon]MBU1941498.1 site-specific integrase [Candidatus Thermoplasmatota archaeon]